VLKYSYIIIHVPLSPRLEYCGQHFCKHFAYLPISKYKTFYIPFLAYVELHWTTIVVDPLTRILSLQPPTVVARARRWLVSLPVTQRQVTPTPHPPVMPLSVDVVYTNPKLFCSHITFIHWVMRLVCVLILLGEIILIHAIIYKNGRNILF